MTNKLDVLDFGDALIRTGDLDPLYIGLRRASARGLIPEPQLCRWLLAYWCFYHVGVASRLSEHKGNDFWKWMKVAAVNEDQHGPFIYQQGPSTRWPRAAERRHFRGDKCVRAVEWLCDQWVDPELPVRSLCNLDTEKEVIKAVSAWPQFGPWIGFKAADMLERVCGLPIKFDRDLGLMYEEPRKALDMMRLNTYGISYQNEVVKREVGILYHKLLTYFSPRRLPAPLDDRGCGPQEVETVLCKWKSYMGGHYHIGKDISEHREALHGWGETADRLLKAYPSEVPAQAYA